MKTIEIADKLYFEIKARLERGEAVTVTPSMIQALYGVSRNTADGVLERIRILSETDGNTIIRAKKGMTICKK